MQTKTFLVTVEVNGSMFRADPETTRRIAREELDRRVSKPLRGPRGGRYEAIAPPHWYGDSDEMGDAFIRNVRVFGAKVNARYVRPR